MFELFLIGMVPVSDYYPEAQPRTNPPCFMQTNKGERLDLSRVCQVDEPRSNLNQPTPQSSQQPSNPNNNQPSQSENNQDN